MQYAIITVNERAPGELSKVTGRFRFGVTRDSQCLEVLAHTSSNIPSSLLKVTFVRLYTSLVSLECL